VLAGSDVLGCAQTGTGKTAAFALPILQRLVEANTDPKRRVIRVLVLSPTRNCDLITTKPPMAATPGLNTPLSLAAWTKPAGSGDSAGLTSWWRRPDGCSI
jgi:hypothetical protein